MGGNGPRRAVHYNPTRTDRMRSAWIVHNPAAGRLPSEILVRRAADVFASHGWSARVETARRRDDLKDLIRRAAEAGAELVVVAGGDGTVGLAANLLRGTSSALAVIPSGTANVWARELGTPPLTWAPGSVERIAESLAEGEIRLADLGEANGRAFLLWAGTGLDARVVNMVEPRRRLDKLLPTMLYIVHTFRSAYNWGGLDLEIAWPGGRVAGRYLVAVASNIRSYGGGLLQLAPQAYVDDGLLDFWILEGRTVGDTVVRMLQLFRRSHARGAAGFVHFRAAEAEFRSASDLAMHYDGEPGLAEAPVHVRVLPKALRVVVPRGAQTTLFEDSRQAVLAG